MTDTGDEIHELEFRWLREDRPGPVWASELERTQESYIEWFEKEGDSERPDLETSRRALEQHMPELVPIWERLVELADGDEQTARLLTLWCPTPYLSGCSQAVYSRGTPMLVRNYDYHPDLCEATMLLSAWSGTRVIASSDCLWGALDGLNEHGLALALSFGGRKAVGDGFGIPLILRYALETCRTTPEAVAVLERVPSHMAYNISVLDAAGRRYVVAVAPDRPTSARAVDVTTNHQPPEPPTRYAKATRSVERERYLYEQLEDVTLDADAFAELFLSAPLFSNDYAHAHGTLYTASYSPIEGKATYLWPGGLRRTQTFEAYEVGELEVDYRSDEATQKSTRKRIPRTS